MIGEAPCPRLPSLAIHDSTKRFTVGRIFCIGRNYADHAREMGADPVREPPFFFTKQPNALHGSERPVPYPARTGNLSHEVELVVAIGRCGRCECAEDAAGYIFGYAVGLDLTRRDLQDQLKSRRHPWDVSKTFDGAAPVGALQRANGVMAPEARIELRINGETRQAGAIGEMIWSVKEILVELSSYQPLAAGDLIFTGTPAGVGPLVSGDELLATVTGLPSLRLSIGA